LDTKEAKSYLILTLISKFSHAYKDMLEGKYLNFTSEELIGGSRIIYVFNETYRKTVSKMNPFDILSDDVDFYPFHSLGYSDCYKKC
jgi:dynamin 1-like protein